jgi:hypothetical protein
LEITWWGTLRSGPAFRPCVWRSTPTWSSTSDWSLRLWVKPRARSVATVSVAAVSVARNATM